MFSQTLEYIAFFFFESSFVQLKTIHICANIEYNLIDSQLIFSLFACIRFIIGPCRMMYVIQAQSLMSRLMLLIGQWICKIGAMTSPQSHSKNHLKMARKNRQSMKRNKNQNQPLHKMINASVKFALAGK